jgi:hypothetical protein
MQTYANLVRRCVLVVTIGLLVASAANAQTPLRWKFKEGEHLNYVLERAVEGKINLSGADIAFKMGMTFDTTWNVKSVAQDGTANVEQTVDRVQIGMSSPLGGNLVYDSQNPEPPAGPVWAQLKPLMEGMLGQTFKAKISSLGKVSDIELPQKLSEVFAKQQQGGNRQAGFGIGGNAFNESGIKEMIEKSVLPLPEAAVGKDVTWKQSFQNPIRGIGTQTAEITYSFADLEQQDGKPVQKISSVTELTFEPADDARADLEITSQEGSAEFYFDPQAGHLIKSAGTQTSALEMSGPRDLTQEIKETTSMRLGKSPAAKPQTEADKSAKAPAK